MFDTNSFSGEIMESGQAVVKNVANSAVKGTQGFVKTTSSQITGSVSSDIGSNEANQAAQNQMSDDQAKQFLKDLYGKTDKSSVKSGSLPGQANQNPLIKAVGMKPKNPYANKTPEEIAKLVALRNQLHSGYFQKLTAKPKNEETVSEKLEREDQQEKMKIFEQEKKKPSVLPATVKVGTGEKMIGVSG